MAKSGASRSASAGSGRVILDSNLVIDAALPEYPGLRRLIADRLPAVSAVSVVEVLGHHKLTATERRHFEAFFAVAEELPLNDPVVARAVALRQSRKMSLGHAIVAATALVLGRELLTRNLKDFTGVPGLALADPLADGDPV